MTQPDPIARTVVGNPAARRQPHRLTFDPTPDASRRPGCPPAAPAPQTGDEQRRGGWLSFAASLAVAVAGLASLPRTPPHAAGASPQPAAALADPMSAVAALPAGHRPVDASVDDCKAPLEPGHDPAPLAARTVAAESAKALAAEPAGSEEGDAGPRAAASVKAEAASVGASAVLPAEARPYPDATLDLIQAVIDDAPPRSSKAVVASPGMFPASDSAQTASARIDRAPVAYGAKPRAVAAPRPVRAMHRGAPALTPLQRGQCGHLGFIGRGFCEQRVRLAYCSGRYGRSADCPLPQPNLAN